MPLFSSGPASSAAYINIRDAGNQGTKASKEFCEDLWSRYSTLADPHFLTEIRTDFFARFWEMYLTCALLEGASTHGYRLTCPKPGPDILLEYEDSRVWIEAIALTKGVPGRPDSVPEPPPSGASRIPEEQVVLRYTNAIREKYRKYLGYLRSRVYRVSGTDGFVVALNEASLGYIPQAANDVPRFLKALYPLGDYQLHLDRDTLEVVGHGNAPRFHILKSNGSTVPVGAFMERRSRAISAILCSFANPGSHGFALGSDFQIAHNPVARFSVPRQGLPGSCLWLAEITDDGANLFSQKLDATL